MATHLEENLSQIDEIPSSQNANKPKLAKPCLICYNSFKPSSSTSRKTSPKKTISNADASKDHDKSATEVDSNLLEDRIRIMFVVRKLLCLPESIIEELLTAHGDPSSWGETCCLCCKSIVEDAEEVAEKIINYQNKLKCLQERVKDEILISAQDKSGCAEDIEISSSVDVINDIRFKFVQRSAIEGVTVSENVKSFRETRGNAVAPPYSPLSIPPESDMDDFLSPPSPVPAFTQQVENVEMFGFYPDVMVKEEQIDIDSEDGWDEDLPDSYLNPEVEMDTENSEEDDELSSEQEESEDNEDENESEDEWRPSASSGKYAKTKQQNKTTPRRRTTTPKRKSNNSSVNSRKSERKNQFKCDECPQYFPSEHFRDAHNRRRHLGIKLCFICESCGKGFERNQSLLSHVKHCNGNYNAEEQSSNRNKSKDESQSEENNNSEEEKESKLLTARRAERKYRFKCPQCPQHFPSEHFRDAHNRRRHLGIKLCFICDKCGKAYDRNQSLEIHKKSCTGDGTFIHPVDPRLQEVPKFKCSKCPRHFPSELTRDAHEKRYHLGLDKPFECQVCKLAFKKQNQLTDHQRKSCVFSDLNPKNKNVKTEGFGSEEKSLFDDDDSKGGDDFDQYFDERDDDHNENDLKEDNSVKTEVKKPPARESSRKTKAIKKIGGSDEEGESPDEDDDSDFNGEEEDNSDEEFKGPGKKRGRKPADPNKPGRSRKRFQCTFEGCKKSFSNATRRDGHVRGDHEGIEEPYVCLTCNKTFKKYISLASHRISHNKKCSVCDKEFLSMREMNSHKKREHPDAKVKNIICELCADTFEKEKDLEYHKHSKHYIELNLEPYECKICGRKSSHPRYLKRHMIVYHPDPSTVTVNCKECNRGFVNQFYLDRHMSSHGVKGAFCEICGKGLANASLLPRHMAIHDVVDLPYECSVCGKKFPLMYRLKRHEAYHGEPKFECEQCGYKCHEKSNLQSHMRVHDPTRVVKVSRWKNVYTENIVSDEKIKKPRAIKFGPKRRYYKPKSSGRPPGRPRKNPIGGHNQTNSHSECSSSLDVEVDGSGYEVSAMNLQIPGTSHGQHQFQVQHSHTQQMQGQGVGHSSYVANNEAYMNSSGSGQHHHSAVASGGIPLWEALALGVTQQAQNHNWFQNN